MGPWNQNLEDEAAWLGGNLLLTEAEALAIAKGRWTKLEAASNFGVSPQMIQFRLNVTGALKQAELSRLYRGHAGRR